MHHSAANELASSNRRLHILVVEDDEFSREMMAHLLSLTGNHSIEVVENAEDGLAHLRADAAYDLVFTDVGLPGMSGLEMVDRAVNDGLISPAHVVVCSAYTSIREAVLARGATCIPKPVDAHKIASMVVLRGNATDKQESS